MSISWRVRGREPMVGVIRKIANVFPKDVGRAMYQEMNVEVVEMKQRCPVDMTPHAPHPGNLRNSIHAELPEIEGNVISVTVATGQQAPYGVYVHENPYALHKVGEWKFMEGPLKESAPYLDERIAVRIDLNRSV